MTAPTPASTTTEDFTDIQTKLDKTKQFASPASSELNVAGQNEVFRVREAVTGIFSDKH